MPLLLSDGKFRVFKVDDDVDGEWKGFYFSYILGKDAVSNGTFTARNLYLSNAENCYEYVTNIRYTYGIAKRHELEGAVGPGMENPNQKKIQF